VKMGSDGQILLGFNLKHVIRLSTFKRREVIGRTLVRLMSIKLSKALLLLAMKD
jgi:hypothetical protein